MAEIETHPQNPYQGGNRSFGRRLGRPLRAHRKDALKKLDSLAIPDDRVTKDRTLDPRTLFPALTPKEIWFELGFGQGEHLRARIAQSPDFAFIGAEPYINGMSNLLMHLPDPSPPNLRVYMDDALFLLKSMTDSSLDGLYVLNPDPWPKKKHHKRRIINPTTLDLFARVLKPGAMFVMSTDVAELAEWMVTQTITHQAFEWTAESRSDWEKPPADWPLTTKYMAWGISEGRRPHFLIFRRR